MNLLTRASQETQEILCNARAAYKAGEIDEKQLADVALSCFRAEVEHQYLQPIADAIP